MARPNPHRRILVTTFNTALATAAVTATAAGWAAFGLNDATQASAAQSSQAIARPIPSDAQPFTSQQPFAGRRHHDEEHEFFGFGDDEQGFSQRQQPASGGLFSQGSSQFRQPITRSRSSR